MGQQRMVLSQARKGPNPLAQDKRQRSPGYWVERVSALKGQHPDSHLT